jgi:hypothetical protein
LYGNAMSEMDNLAFATTAENVDEDYIFDSETAEWLPPEKYWQYDILSHANKVPTPVNALGLVDTHRAVEIVRSAIEPEYKWPGHVLNVHHEYWNKTWYGYPSAGERAQEFRELPINKLLVPRVFENVLHHVLLQPDIPKHDVMESVVESYEVTKRLFLLLQVVVRCQRGVVADHKKRLEARGILLPPGLTKERLKSQQIILDTLPAFFELLDKQFDELEQVEPEFRLIEPDRQAVVSPERRKKYSGALGRIVVPKAMAMTRPLVASA